MFNFTHRSKEKEWLDDLELGGEQLRENLDEIGWINKNLGGLAITRDGVAKALETLPKNRAIRVADLGCGGGDALRDLADWAKKKDHKIDLIGVDANPNVVEYARKHTVAYPSISYTAANLFSQEVEALKLDVVHCGLFMHHLSCSEIVEFLQTCQKRNWILVINDLQRSKIAYVLFLLVSGLLRFSKASRHDGAISVKRSFTKADLNSYIRQTKVAKHKLSWKWAFRYQLIIWPNA